VKFNLFSVLDNFKDVSTHFVLPVAVGAVAQLSRNDKKSIRIKYKWNFIRNSRKLCEKSLEKLR
jgi:hypothetical protein